MIVIVEKRMVLRSDIFADKHGFLSHPGFRTDGFYDEDDHELIEDCHECENSGKRKLLWPRCLKTCNVKKSIKEKVAENRRNDVYDRSVDIDLAVRRRRFKR